MVGFAATGELEYNGVEFLGANHITAQAEPVQDEAQRTVIYHRTTIRVQATIQADAGTNTTLEEMRAKLCKQGGALRFINKGFGADLLVNVSPGGVRDVKWGPVPKILSWEPEASINACQVEWEVVTCIAMCNSTLAATNGKILAMNYEADYRIDSKGFTTRTITGYLEIAQTRTSINNRTPPACADSFRNLISPQPPTGFIRDQSWTDSKDKSRIDFTITDDQIRTKNPWPPAVVDIRSSQDVVWQRSRGQGGAMTLRSTLDAEIELVAGAPQIFGFIIFGALVAQRAGYAHANQAPVFLDSVRVREDIFGYTSQFSASWRVLRGLNELLGGTGLWQPVGTNWNVWRTTLNGSVFHQRGHARLQLHAQNDAIVDICGTGQTIPWNSQAPQQQQSQQYANYPFRNGTPPAQQSYLDYRMYIVPWRRRPVVRQSPMQTPDVDQGSGNMRASQPVVFNQSSGQQDVLSQGGQAIYGVTLVGYARRAGHQIPRPILKHVGGVPAVEVGGVFSERCIGAYFGVPVFEATWKIDYLLAQSPGVVHSRSPIADELATAAAGAEDPPGPPPTIPSTGKWLGPDRRTLWIAPTFPNAP